MFIDEVRVTVESGKGGDGIIAFRREKHVPLAALPEATADGEEASFSKLMKDSRLSMITISPAYPSEGR